MKNQNDEMKIEMAIKRAVKKIIDMISAFSIAILIGTNFAFYHEIQVLKESHQKCTRIDDLLE